MPIWALETDTVIYLVSPDHLTLTCMVSILCWSVWVQFQKTQQFHKVGWSLPKQKRYAQMAERQEKNPNSQPRPINMLNVCHRELMLQVNLSEGSLEMIFNLQNLDISERELSWYFPNESELTNNVNMSCIIRINDFLDVSHAEGLIKLWMVSLNGIAQTVI